MTSKILKSFEINERINNIIKKGIEKGEWAHFSEAARDLIKRGLKQGIESGDFSFLKAEDIESIDD